MSQRSTLSPHPFSYRRRDPSDPSFVQYSAMDASLDNPGNSFGRRRTVHPHNPPMHRIHRSQEDTPERSRPNPPPRLEHRASQTLTIDLTDDNDELPQDEPPRPREQPRAGRNSGVNESNVIDLTDDNDVEITRVAPRPLPSLSDMALNVPRNQIPRMNRRLPFLPQEPARSINRVFPAHNPMPRGFHVTALGQGEIIFHPSPNFLDHIQMLEDATAIIGQMDRQIDLQRENGAAAHSRPDHIAPPDAKAGFTRSPTEKDVVICPSCEEELIQDKDPDEVAVKKSGKAPTRKEREEHPFWVVKSCGHVSFLVPFIMLRLIRDRYIATAAIRTVCLPSNSRKPSTSETKPLPPEARRAPSRCALSTNARQK